MPPSLSLTDKQIQDYNRGLGLGRLVMGYNLSES